MNTDIALLAPVAGPEFERAASMVLHVFSDVEKSLSRFLPESELFALNQSSGNPVQVSPLLFGAVSLAVRAAEETNGVFDPTILSALEHAGYDRSFEHVGAGSGAPRPPHRTARLPDYRAVRCHPETRTIQLLDGQRLDLGGIGKGIAVDLAIAETSFLRERCIAAGGDVAVRGTAGPDAEWTVALEDTGAAGSQSIALRDAAVASSTTLRRRWQRAGEERHHLIDHRTGRPSSSAFRTVTVVAASCVEADVAAKTALLLGEQGMDFLEGKGLHGMAVRHDGSTIATREWPWPKGGI
ncbi:MAG: FAD:protein FMN transferase [Chloroflexota bacterium]|nr:MAG: hypothetical protein DLM70_15860 [Chloroflexota bacterium]